MPHYFLSDNDGRLAGPILGVDLDEAVANFDAHGVLHTYVAYKVDYPTHASLQQSLKFTACLNSMHIGESIDIEGVPSMLRLRCVAVYRKTGAKFRVNVMDPKTSGKARELYNYDTPRWHTITRVK